MCGEKKYGLWFSPSTQSYTLALLEAIQTQPELFSQGDQLFHTIVATSYADACQKRNDILGWGKYIPHS